MSNGKELAASGISVLQLMRSKHSHQRDCDHWPRAVQKEGIQLVCEPKA